jgi:hypothetical protein
MAIFDTANINIKIDLIRPKKKNNELNDGAIK